MTDDSSPSGGELHYYKGRGVFDRPLPAGLSMERTILGTAREIERLGSTTTFDRARMNQRPIRRPRRSAKLTREVELRERGFVDYSVTLGSGAREDILTEIRRAHQAAGEAVEACGWLFAWHRPRAESSFTTIALATRSIERSGTRSEVFLSDPVSAITAVRGAGYERMELVGDWHSHTYRGSELPSLADARAWCGTMDSLARSAYLSLIVSPSEELGWGSPKFSAWVAGRYGSPSRPVVGRATLR